MPRSTDIRLIVVDGLVAYVPLTKGFRATIDAGDVPLVEGHNWTANLVAGKCYAGRTERGATRALVLMHRVIFGARRGVHVDHRDGDSLNNRRANLREATVSQNMRNVGVSVANRSGFKGVHLHKPSGKWRSQIRTASGRKSLGIFDTPEAAHEAYREAAIKLHGEFARF